MKRIEWLTKSIVFLILGCASAFAQTGKTINDFFDANVLQEIRLEVNPKDWAALKATPLSDTYYEATLTWRGVEVDNIGIRQRGASTRNGIKPGLRLDFNRFEPGQTFLGLKSLGLDNNTQDLPMMRERITMELYTKLGLPAPREVSAKLYVNDDYYGVFTVIEPTDKNFLKRVFGDDSGYLYEYANTVAYHFEYLGSNPALYSPRFFDPKTHESDPDPAPIEAMIKTMNTASDADFASAIAPYIDLNLFMRFFAIEDFVAETDGILAGMNNFYLYRFPNGKSQFLPKDKDRAFGGEPRNGNRPQTPLLANASKNVLIRRALAVPAAREAYLRGLADAAQFAGPGSWMEGEVTRIYNQIHDAVLADPVKQCYDGINTKPCTNADFETEITATLQFARERGAFVVGQIVALSGGQFFALGERGGTMMTSNNNAPAVAVGYGLIDTDTISAMPTGVAMFAYRQNGVAVSETSIPSTAALQHGLIYGEIQGRVRSGIAIVNPSSNSATVSLSYTDGDGKLLGRASVPIAASAQIAKFLDEAPFNLSGPVRVAVTFDSSTPVFVTALRALVNERSDVILSSLPVVAASPSTGTTLIPHFADGGGWSTQTILVNPTSQAMSGSIQFVDQKTQSVTTVVMYSVAPGAYYRYETAGTPAAPQVGSVWIVPSGSTATPAAFAVFSYRKDGVTVSEASVPALVPAASDRLFAENSDSIQTGLAIANASTSPITVQVEATSFSDSNKTFTTTVTIPGRGQIASFLRELPGFDSIGSFQGLLKVSTPAPNLAVAGLRGRVNERGDFLIATIPVVDEAAPSARTELSFPHFVSGGGFTTQFVLFSGTANSTSSGVIRLFDQSGNPLTAW